MARGWWLRLDLPHSQGLSPNTPFSRARVSNPLLEKSTAWGPVPGLLPGAGEPRGGVERAQDHLTESEHGEGGTQKGVLSCQASH